MHTFTIFIKLILNFRFAGNKTVMRIVAQVFNCSESTFFVVFNRVVDFLLNILPSIIKMPSSNDEIIQCAYEFKQVILKYNSLYIITKNKIKWLYCELFFF